MNGMRRQRGSRKEKENKNDAQIQDQKERIKLIARIMWKKA